jgi:hypothetical protein
MLLGLKLTCFQVCEEFLRRVFARINKIKRERKKQQKRQEGN